jgi:hypothetical protein
MVLLGDEGLGELCSVRLEIVLILTQDRCTVCTECTIGYKLFWRHPTELISDVGHVESHFSQFIDSFSVSAM